MEQAGNLETVALQTETLESEVKAFAESLPYWLQYLCEKLLAGISLSDADIDLAYSYFLQDVGLEATTARPDLIINCIGVVSTAYKTDLLLSKLQNVEGVNALVENQVMEFSPNVTIIYGINGSGKSSYIRLLKKSFINKAADEPILPNVHLTNGYKDVKAEFVFSSSGSNYTLTHPDDCTKAEFHQFSVFDNKCAPVHLNIKNKFEFRPAGLCFFADLAEAINKVEEKIIAGINLKNATVNFSNSFEGESEIKTHLINISAKTKIETLKSYLPFSEEDKKKQESLEKHRAELLLLKVDNEVAKIKEKQKQIEALKTQIINSNKFFTSEQVIKAQNAILDCLKKEAIVQKDGIENFKSDSIKNIGGVEWKFFIEAAEKFAKRQVEGLELYPISGDNCLLCHQPLSEEAQKLINSYWSYIKSQAEQDAKNAQEGLKRAIASYEKLVFNLLPEDYTLNQWLLENYPEELKRLENSIKSQERLAQNLIKDLVNKTTNSLEQNQIAVQDLENIIAALTDKIDILNSKDPSTEILKIDEQLRFLNHKEKLVQHIPSIEAYIQNLIWADTANVAKNKLPKKKVTDKEKELSKKYFNQVYIDTFNKISHELNGNFGIEINHTGSSGSSYRQLVLKGKQPAQILSEGEQKVISLADYLAEVELSGINKGIIFDDPVTSLDNDRKKQIAECLTKESKKRQVIIFTHDLVFFYHLKNFAKKHLSFIQNSFVHHSLLKDEAKLCGKIIMNFSPATEGQYTDAVKATEWLNKSKRVPDEEKLDCIKSGYSAIRASYEALAIFIIMGGVVQRFDPQIRMGRLKDLKVDKALIDKVIEKHGEISDLIEGHLPSDEFGVSPDAEMLELQIKEFSELKEEFKKIRLN